MDYFFAIIFLKLIEIEIVIFLCYLFMCHYVKFNQYLLAYSVCVCTSSLCLLNSVLLMISVYQRNVLFQSCRIVSDIFVFVEKRYVIYQRYVICRVIIIMCVIYVFVASFLLMLQQQIIILISLHFKVVLKFIGSRQVVVSVVDKGRGTLER